MKEKLVASLHKKCSFPLRIPSVNLTKSAVSEAEKKKKTELKTLTQRSYKIASKNVLLSDFEKMLISVKFRNLL